MGQFIIQAVKVEHNAPNYAYVIDTPDHVRIIFATDCIRFPYKVKNVNVILCEANYSDDIIINHLCENQSVYSRSEYHMEINDTIECIRNNFSSELNTICLLHLSDGQSDENDFKKRIYDEFGITPYIATIGLTIELNKEEF